VFSWFLWRMEELRKADEEGFTLIELLAVTKRSVRERSKIPREARYVRSHIRSATTSRLFNPSAWKGHSQKFAAYRALGRSGYLMPR
jgi:hypothetical protein